MWPRRQVLAALACTGLGFAAVAAGPVPPPPPIQQPSPPLSTPATPNLLPHLPPEPMPTDRNLRSALATLDELDALLVELRTSPKTCVNPEKLSDLTKESAARRKMIQGQAVDRSAGVENKNLRISRTIIHWVSEASVPLHEARLACLHSETEELRFAVEREFADLEDGSRPKDDLPGPVAQLHRQARVYWDEGDIASAATAYSRLQTAIRDAHLETAARREALAAQAEEAAAREIAETSQAPRYASASWQQARDLAREAEAAFATKDYAAASTSWKQATDSFEEAISRAAPAVHLARAEARYQSLARGLDIADLEKMGTLGTKITTSLASALDDQSTSDSRTASYDAAIRQLLELRLDEARDIRREQPEVALDHLAAVLRGDRENQEARELFAALANRSGWWLTQARFEGQHATDPYYRISLYGLLARTRRQIGDQAGAARARAAAIALVRQQTADAWVPPPVFDLLPEFIAAHDAAGVRDLVTAARASAPPAVDVWRRALWLAQLSGFAERAGETTLAQTLSREAATLVPGREPWVLALVAATANRHAAAREQWQALARLAADPAHKVHQATVVDLGGRLLQAAAEAGDEEAVTALRSELLLAAAREEPKLATTITWTSALASASARRWADVPDRAAPGWTAERLRQFALLRARQGEVGAAIDLLQDVLGPECQFACWQIAAAWSANPRLDLADLFVWIEELPDAGCRCAAFLGVASALSHTRPAGTDSAALKRR